MTGLVDLLSAGREPPGRVYGVVTGVVTNNQDPDGLARVKVRFPWLSGGDESAWARPAVPMAGPDAGTYFLPDVDDEVLVAFEQGDVRFPYVLGSLWRGGGDAAEPPEDNADGKNARKTIRTRSGLTITLDDSDGAEQIVIAGKQGKPRIVIDAAQDAITIEGGDVSVKATSGKLALEGTQVEISSSGTMKVKATGTLDLEGATASVKGGVVRLG
jgi:uncharacterized protein involved in type VI secretion and phage assembly